jgi:hypothetical protein
VTRGTDLGGGAGEEGVHRSKGFHGGGAKEQPRASAKGSRELTTSMRSSGRCQGSSEGDRGGGLR